jgi:hypothetical protein
MRQAADAAATKALALEITLMVSIIEESYALIQFVLSATLVVFFVLGSVTVAAAVFCHCE